MTSAVPKHSIHARTTPMAAVTSPAPSLGTTSVRVGSTASVRGPSTSTGRGQRCRMRSAAASNSGSAGRSAAVGVDDGERARRRP